MQVIAARRKFLEHKGVNLYIAADTFKPGALAGNKRFKLLPNIRHAKQEGYAGVLSFGGAFSNHIHALSYLAHAWGLPSIGVIRGERNYRLNPTLQDATRWGMQLEFVSRKQYQQRHDPLWQAALLQKFPGVLIVPEGGSNSFAVKSCQRLLDHVDPRFLDQINLYCCAVGTGATICGLVQRVPPDKAVRGYAVVADCTRDARMKKWLCPSIDSNLRVVNIKSPRYGKLDLALVRYIDQFYLDTQILLDPVYTGKALWQLEADIVSGAVQVRGDVLFVHTGGIQGWRGYLSEFDSALSAETKSKIRQMTVFEEVHHE